MFQTQEWDAWLFELLNQRWRSGDLDCLMPLVSEKTLLWVLVVLAAGWLWRRGGLRSAALLLVVLAALGLTDLCTQMVKESVGRVRPVNALAGTYHHDDDCRWKRRPDDFVSEETWGSSFVSGHSANTMAIAVMSILLWRGLRLWPLLLPLIVGWSRIYLGKHYPSDVLGGWLLGAAVAFVVWSVWRWAVNRRGP